MIRQRTVAQARFDLTQMDGAMVKAVSVHLGDAMGTVPLKSLPHAACRSATKAGLPADQVAEIVYLLMRMLCPGEAS